MAIGTMNRLTKDLPCFPDDRCVVPHESIASKHRPHHHLRGGTFADGSDRVRRFLEVSA